MKMPYRNLPDLMRDELVREFLALDNMAGRKLLSREDAAGVAFDRKLFMICTYLDQCNDYDYIRFQKNIKSDYKSFTARQNEEAVPMK